MNPVRRLAPALASATLVLLACTQLAQATADNPFAPLRVASAARPVAVRPMPASPPSLPAPEPITALAVGGVLWCAERPVAIINNVAVTLGSRVGSATVTAIQPTEVALTDAGGQVATIRLAVSLAAGAAGTEPNERTLSLHVQEVSCRSVLEALAYQGGRNLVFVSSADRVIRLHLQNVTWDEALQAVARAGGCVVAEEGRTLTVSDEEATLHTLTFPLNYGRSKDLETAVTNLLSAQGKLGIDERLNALVITDTSEHLERIETALQHLDRRAPQVLIEVLIVNVILSDESKMGINWQIIGSPAQGEGIALTQSLNTSSLQSGSSLNTGSPNNPYGALNFYTVGGDWRVSGLFDFIRSHEDVTVLANPKVLVLNNRTATIDAVTQIPYQELQQTGQGQPIGTTAFKDAGVKLRVTPQISDDGYIVMHIEPEQSVQTGTFTVDGTDTPVIDTRKTATDLRVKDGQTVIIGGLRKKEPFRKESRLPLLGDLPLVGKLFRQVHLKQVDSELGVFITPHVYRENPPSGQDLTLVEGTDDMDTLWNRQVFERHPSRRKE